MRLVQLFSVAAVALSTCLAKPKAAVQHPDELEAATAAKTKQLVPKSDYVIELDQHKYLDVVSTHDNVLIEFYANWCAACHSLSSDFNAFAEAVHRQYPDVVVARADITKIEYLSSSYMIGLLPELVFIHRSAPGATPEVRYVTANFTKDGLLDYIANGWMEDKPIGGYSTLWCTPTNLCGHIGGLLGELVVVADKRFNPFDIPPWSFMAIIVSVVYLVGQVAVGYLGKVLRRKYHDMIMANEERSSIKPVYFNEHRADKSGTESEAPSTPPTSKQPKSGSAAKRAKSKRTKRD
ncbi:hypothetical protein H4R20_002643 [Coemansia guatemalensis]|uniref:Thioredoxin domain-containing protein n=1 Tax=Coemansia guatemalensis TaxID=2761395 RepID=A0A9W8LUU3_9FUNG|nr:hypothetical protein H4R20_002643 [Coemansia guatemalensis]